MRDQCKAKTAQLSHEAPPPDSEEEKALALKTSKNVLEKPIHQVEEPKAEAPAKEEPTPETKPVEKAAVETKKSEVKPASRVQVKSNASDDEETEEDEINDISSMVEQMESANE